MQFFRFIYQTVGIVCAPRSNAALTWATNDKGEFVKARIYQPAKNAMQSGTAGTHDWILEFEPETGKTIDSVMGWTGSSDMRGQVKLRFETLDEAKAYAERNSLPFEVKAVHKKKRRIQAYADNFK